jgi:hypothetical protein
MDFRAAAVRRALGVLELRARRLNEDAVSLVYGYRAGPEGAEVLEFRHATEFDIKLDEKPEVFDRIAETVKENRDQWAADSVRPSRR